MTLEKSFSPLCLCFPSYLLCMARQNLQIKNYFILFGVNMSLGTLKPLEEGIWSCYQKVNGDVSCTNWRRNHSTNACFPLQKYFRMTMQWGNHIGLTWEHQDLLNQAKTNWKEREEEELRDLNPYLWYENRGWPSSCRNFTQLSRSNKYRPETACNQQARCEELIKR